MSIFFNKKTYIEISIFMMSLTIAILSWLSNLELTPDSTNYVAAAQNFLHKGFFFVNVNWPSFSLDSNGEIFSDYPPGFSILFIIFLLLFKSNLFAIAFSQCIYIFLFYSGIYILINKLKINIFLRIIIYLSIPFFSFYTPIINTYLTEILFISITLFIGAISINLINNSLDTKNWIIAILLISISTTIKFLGILNIFWLVVPFLTLSNNLFKSKIFALGLIVISSPTLAWFARNLNYSNTLTQSHGLGSTFHSENLLAPFIFLTTTPFGREFQTILILNWILLIILMAPNKWRSLSGKNNKTTLIETSLYIVFITNFLGIYIFSVLTSINQLEFRLLSIPITILVILYFYKLDYNFRIKQWLVGPLLLPAIIIFALSPAFSFHISNSYRFLPAQPEQELWGKIEMHPPLIGASIVYTDINFNHQIYSQKPQIILWQTNDDFLEKVIKKSRKIYSFFIFNSDSDLLDLMYEKFSNSSKFCMVDYSKFTIIYPVRTDIKERPCPITSDNF